MSNISEQILAHLNRNGPARAKDIADSLGATRLEVNQALYGVLKALVQQQKDFRWSIAKPASDSQKKPPSSAAPGQYTSLFSYYLDCLSQDDDSGVSVFAASKFKVDYAELDFWPLEDGSVGSDSEPVRDFMGRYRQSGRSKKALWIGYPVVIRTARGRSGWEGRFVEPILLWPHDATSGAFEFFPEPQINLKALRGLVGQQEALDEAALLADELSLDASDPPPLDELIARLREIRRAWPWKEPLLPAPLRTTGELSALVEDGIYNAAVVVMADKSMFTQGLERDLSDLRATSEQDIERSALATFLGASVPTTTQNNPSPLLEVAPLNTEQRAAVQDALIAPLTVVTGPPGTGKSQVVAAILVNAAWRGMRVLFASKNNKAVDVVFERVNALTTRPTMLRLGSRMLQDQLAQHLTAILSSRPSSDQRLAYENSLIVLRRLGEVLANTRGTYEAVIRKRNVVDGLERVAESARLVLGEAAFARARSILSSDLPARIAALEQALANVDRKDSSILHRLSWPLVKKALLQECAGATMSVREGMRTLGLTLPPDSQSKVVLDDARKQLEAVRAASDYQQALSELSALRDVGDLAKELAVEAGSASGVALDVWSGWTALLPDRLTAEDRRLIGDYAALLRTIAKTQEDKGTVTRQVWARYFELSGNVSKALPCWAVTSLSVRGRIPLNPGEFDLVVIDEASQCDIASALPLLYRAKRAVIIGDPQQLSHISRLPSQRDQALMVKHGILNGVGPSWSYRANSLYGLAASRVSSDAVVTLRDHHRSHAAIINFSNEFFYEGRLRVATKYSALRRPNGPALRWVDVRGRVVRPFSGGAFNKEEALAVVQELRRLVVEQKFVGEVGVVTPFRAQANLINEVVRQDNALSALLAARNFAAETAHRFQGDERDVMIFSPVVSEGMPDSAEGFLESQGSVFNVGITRARGALVVVGDATACANSSARYLREFVKYVASYSKQERKRSTLVPAGDDAVAGDYPSVARPAAVSDWEKVLYSALVRAGVRPLVQHDVDRFTLDLALIRPNGRKLDIEVDGAHYHRDWNGELIHRDQLRNLRMIELGWDVMRFWVYQIRDDLEGCVAKVTNWVAKSDAFPSVSADSEVAD